jgi:hypothetical protein
MGSRLPRWFRQVLYQTSHRKLFAEWNPSNSALSGNEQGGFFLKKKLLEEPASAYTCPDSAVGAYGTAIALPTRRVVFSSLAGFSCIRAPLGIRCSRRPKSAGRVRARNVSARASTCVCCRSALDLASSAAISIRTAEDPRPLWTLHRSAELNDPTGWDLVAAPHPPIDTRADSGPGRGN